MTPFSKNLPFVRPASIQYNPLKALSYIAAYPLVIFFKYYKVTPNFVSFLSFLFAVAAFASLAYNILYAYMLCWFCSYLLDFADGTLARMTLNVRKTSLRVDHYSDILKFIILFLGYSLYFDSVLLEVLCFLSASSYLFYTLLNHDAKYIQKPLKVKVVVEKPISISAFSLLSFLASVKLMVKSNSYLSRLVLILLTTFTTLDGHIMIIFFLIPINSNLAAVLLIYFIVLASLQSIRRLYILSSSPRIS